ncbi:MAG TPA: ABC transporter permease, partial [Pseudoduganella sp.]
MLEKPLIADPRVRRALAPLALGFLLLAVWQAVCVSMQVPVYLVPSPTAIAGTLVEDWQLLFDALLVTLRITFLAFALATVAGVAVAFLFVQSK